MICTICRKVISRTQQRKVFRFYFMGILLIKSRINHRHIRCSLRQSSTEDIHRKSIQVTMSNPQFQRITGIGNLVCTKVQLRLQKAFFQLTQCRYPFIVGIKVDGFITSLQSLFIFTYIAIITCFG